MPICKSTMPDDQTAQLRGHWIYELPTRLRLRLMAVT
jgi:hypothetical protein